MDFLRRHLFFIISGVVGAGAIALGVVGLQRMPAVKAEMQTVQRLYDSLSNCQPVNRDQLDQQQERIDSVVADRQRVFEKVRELYGYEPLDPDAFPLEDSVALTNFRREYRKAMSTLMDRLNSGRQPTPRDIDIMQSEIENERAERAESRSGRGSSAVSGEPEGPSRTVAGVLTRDGALENAEARAAMANAQRIFCYAIHFDDVDIRGALVPSLQFEQSMNAAVTLDAPEIDAAWYAQVGYWIQKDVVDAIVAVNQEAADAANRAGQNAWLGIMPVKEVVSIRVLTGYVPDVGEPVPGSPPDGPEEAYPPGTPDSVFTRSGSNASYEVVQFSVKLVMDVRDINKFVERLCTDSFHTLLRVAYETVDANLDMTGKIYGSEPTVQVVMDFETLMLGEVFRPLIPTYVCDDFGIDCPARPEEEEE